MPRVLVIEDNHDAADALAMVLQIRGHEVTLAFNGAEGLAKIRELRPDVILCDLGLPGLNGYELARTVRRDESIAATFLVAVSGYASEEDVRRATEAGFNAHLAKPVAFDHLDRILNEIPPRA